MNNEQKIHKLSKLLAKKLSDLSLDEVAEIETYKVKLGAYWRDPRELFARLVEQYIATKVGGGPSVSPDYTNSPGWWKQADFEPLMPLIEKEVNRRLEIMRGGAEGARFYVRHGSPQGDYGELAAFFVSTIGYSNRRPSVIVAQSKTTGLWKLVERKYLDGKWEYADLSIEMDLDQAKKTAEDYLKDKVQPKVPGDTLASITPLSREFYDWFGDSKVVDESGQPMVVYHGTDKNFTEFSPTMAGSNSSDFGKINETNAYFFSDNPDVASDYAHNYSGDPTYIVLLDDLNKKRDEYQEILNKSEVKDAEEYRNNAEITSAYESYELARSAYFDYLGGYPTEPSRGSRVLPIYASIKNPLEVDADLAFSADVLQDYLKRAAAEGRDGLIVKNIIDPAKMYNNIPATLVVAFSPEQIKSVLNRGTWDESNPNILFSQKPIQSGFFDANPEDLPLFSQTPMKAQEELFNPQEEVKQPDLFGSTTPQIEARASRSIRFTVAGKGVNERMMLDINDIPAIRELRSKYGTGFAVKWAIVDGTGAVFKTGDGFDKLLPKGQTLFSMTQQDAPGSAWATPQQDIGSSVTSISYPDPKKKAPIIFTAFRDKKYGEKVKIGDVNADIGGGRFDAITEWLQDKYDIENVVWDRFNRSQEFNDQAENILRGGGADTATVSNVLNVIPHDADDSMRSVISTAYDAVKPGGTAYFSMYNSGKRGPTSNGGYQRAEPVSHYLPFIYDVFGKENVSIVGSAGSEIVIARKAGETLFSSRSIAPQSPEFARWFGDSKVVDESGQPMVVYHGTNSAFDVFESGEGLFFFTGGQKEAKAYGREQMPVYLKMDNPLEIDLFGQEDNAIRELAESAREDGYDGLIARNTNDGYYDLDQYIVFSPEQIKSVFNRGTYDPNNPSILASLQPAPSEYQPGDKITILNRGDGVILDRLADAKNGQKRYRVRLANGERVNAQGTAISPRKVDPDAENVRQLSQQAVPEPTVEAVQSFEYGDLNIIANVYITEDGARKLVAYLPDQWGAAKWQNGDYRLLGLDPTNPDYWVFQRGDGGIYPRLRKTPSVAVNAPLGTVDQLNPQPPALAGQVEGYHQFLRPILGEMEKWMTAPQHQTRIKLETDKASVGRVANAIRKSVDGAETIKLSEKDAQLLRGYLQKVYGQMSTERLGAMRHGEMKRDMALLNYTKRTNFDNMLGAIFPYQFWYTRSMLNWAMRFMDHPSILAGWARLQRLGNRDDKEGYPSRLNGKVQIPFPFLPTGGNSLFIDPMRQMFPFEQFTRPLTAIAGDNNKVTARTIGILQEWARAGTYDTNLVTEATTNKAGKLWDEAWKMAMQETDLETSNPFDLASTMISPSLPINWLYNMARGTPENISNLPATRAIKGITGLLGIGEPGGMNVEKPLRDMLGLGSGDKWEDYRYDRELANMTAEGLITSDEAIQAMIERSGDLYDEARRRVGKVGGIRYIFSSISADMYPEGERLQRENAKKFAEAIEAEDGGEEGAINKFFEEHPDFEARLAQMREPEPRLRQYLISNIWDAYVALGKNEKKQVREQMGDLFQQAFLDKETRSYDAIETDTLSMWARALAPETTPKSVTAPQMDIEIDQDLADAVNAYYNTREELFPNIDTIQSFLYSLPEDKQDAFRKQYKTELNGYSKWRNEYLADNPQIIPEVESEQSDLSGLPAEISTMVYRYRTMREQMFPNVMELQDQYFTFDKAGRKSFLVDHPELADYWDWRKEFAATFPKVAPYILSDETMSAMIRGENKYSGGSGGTGTTYSGATGYSGYSSRVSEHPPYLTSTEAKMFSPALIRAIIAYVYRGEKLQSGAMRELQGIFDKTGQPGGDIDTYIQMYVRPSLNP